MKMSRFDFLSRELDSLKDADLLRSLRCIDSAQGPVVRIGSQEKLIFCSNNYLNLANHPAVTAAAIEAVGQFGYGASASRLITGTMAPHVRLEQALAKLLTKKAALVFSSGFAANEAALTTIAQKGDLLLLDKLSHASLIDSAKASAADFRTYRRGDYVRVEKFLAQPKYKNKFIVTESVFSMDGDSPDLAKLIELKNKYDAFLVLDEAHAFGCFGTNGAGLASQLGLLDEVDIFIATLSKALGCSGGFIAGEKSLIDYLINKARGFIYTTAGPPANCAAALAAIEILKAEPDRRERLKSNADYLQKRLAKLPLNLGQSRSQIIPVIVGEVQKAIEMAEKLFKMGLIVCAIRPPTVAAGTARLRISVQCDHTKEQLDALAGAIEQII